MPNPLTPYPSRKRGHGLRNSKLWADSLLRAKSQAETYTRSLPNDNPPFPDNLSHRFKLTDLADSSNQFLPFIPLPFSNHWVILK